MAGKSQETKEEKQDETISATLMLASGLIGSSNHDETEEEEHLEDGNVLKGWRRHF